MVASLFRKIETVIASLSATFHRHRAYLGSLKAAENLRQGDRNSTIESKNNEAC